MFPCIEDIARLMSGNHTIELSDPCKNLFCSSESSSNNHLHILILQCFIPFYHDIYSLFFVRKLVSGCVCAEVEVGNFALKNLKELKVIKYNINAGVWSYTIFFSCGIGRLRCLSRFFWFVSKQEKCYKK